VIDTAAALAGIVPSRRIRRGRESARPAVTHPAVHTLPASPAPVVPSLVAHNHSLSMVRTTRYSAFPLIILS